MNQSEINQYVLYRLRRSQESLEDAEILSKQNRWNAIVNRLYYACFYSVIALLLDNGFKVKSHDGARTQFGLVFIKSGIIDKKFGKLYSKLFDFRQKGDYGDIYDFDEETVKPLINLVSEFLDEINKHFDFSN